MPMGKALLRSQTPCWHPSTLCGATEGRILPLLQAQWCNQLHEKPIHGRVMLGQGSGVLLSAAAAASAGPRAQQAPGTILVSAN